MPATIAIEWETETETAEFPAAAEWTPESMEEFDIILAEKVLAGELDGWKIYGVPYRNTERTDG